MSRRPSALVSVSLVYITLKVINSNVHVWAEAIPFHKPARTDGKTSAVNVNPINPVKTTHSYRTNATKAMLFASTSRVSFLKTGVLVSGIRDGRDRRMLPLQRGDLGLYRPERTTTGTWRCQFPATQVELWVISQLTGG